VNSTRIILACMCEINREQKTIPVYVIIGRAACHMGSAKVVVEHSKHRSALSSSCHTMPLFSSPTRLQTRRTTSLFHYTTNSMEQSPSWEANSHSASWEIPHLLWHIHNSLPQVPIPSQMNPVHTFSPPFPMIHSNIILPAMPILQSGLFPSDFPN